MDKSARFGLIAMLSWCLISAGADVYVSKIVATIDPTLLCFGIFLCATLFFAIWNFKNRQALYKKIGTHFKTLVKINITTFIAWYFTIYPLKYIEPSIVVAVILATLPIATLISGILLKSDKAVATSHNITVSVLLFFGISFLAAIVFTHHSAMQHVSLLPAILSFLACIASGFALGVNNIHTKQLSRSGFTPVDILTTRFLLTVLVTGLIIHHQIPTVIHHYEWLYILIAGLAMVIIPQTIFQYALQAVEPYTTSIIASLKAVAVFGLEFFNQELILTAWTIVGVAYLACVGISGTLLQNRRQEEA
jgi:drug/metabolite transporter (DMT)-like permease